VGDPPALRRAVEAVLTDDRWAERRAEAAAAIYCQVAGATVEAQAALRELE
jgi:UDP:flavonoid glycosyltransferase YjiC (YdhE family)